jgi:uncharacterized membrane protein
VFILQALAATLVFTLVGFVCVRPWFRHSPDGGLGLYPWVGLFLTSYVTFWLAFVPTIRAGSSLVWTVILGLVLVIPQLTTKVLKTDIISAYGTQIPFRFWVLHSLFFLSLAAGYLFFRSQAPDIFGIEKLPDFSFLQSIYTYGQLPPPDLFTAGTKINYYYFGFFELSTLAWTGLITANEAFHVGLAFMLGSSGGILLSFFIYLFPDSKTQTLGRFGQWLAPFAAGIALAFAYLLGNAQAFFADFIQSTSQNFWYPVATRYIENTIHEFPLYSLLIGDVHAHLLDLPNTLLLPFLLFLFAESYLKNSTLDLPRRIRSVGGLLVALGLSFGASYVTNSWNIFTNLLLAGFSTWFLLRPKGLFNVRTLMVTALLCLLFVVLSIVLYLPFWVSFSPMTDGLRVIDPAKSSPTLQLLIIWFVHATLPAIWLLWANRSDDVRARYFRILIGLAIGLIAFMEIFYFQDIYSGHLRANTLFKIGLQVWLWLSVATGFVIAEALSKSHRGAGWWWSLVALTGLMSVGSYYTWKAVPQYLSTVKGQAGSLAGLGFLERRHSELLPIIRWLSTNRIEGQAVLEAASDSFSEGGLVTAFSGTPTVVTWFNHAWLWHGQPQNSILPKSDLETATGRTDTLAQRRTDVEVIYQSGNTETVRALLKKYRVRYVLVSKNERKLYPRLDENPFHALGQVAVESATARLYEVKP